ncbi:MAG TPA: phosphoenolpyruvate--protein phosphotransferase [Elusimicrobiota bacterium]|nr:phosphoenolpyruvate--protein phosphotransferase [Elusimicrobiota bacterium]
MTDPLPQQSHPFEKNASRVFRGIPASPGIAIGKACVFAEETDLAVGRWQVPPESIKAEVTRFRNALAETKKEMLGIQQQVLKLLGKSHVRLIEAYILILEDPLITKDVVKHITQNRVNAEYALSDAVAGAVKTLEAAPDEYFRERRHDILDVGRKILMHLMGRAKQPTFNLTERCVVVAHNLTPSDTLHLRTHLSEGFITDIGGKTSHTAILAQSLEIPAVVGLRDITRHVHQGDILIVDGYSGTVLINPQADVIENYKREKEIRAAKGKELEKLKNQPATTLDGHRVSLAANIDSPEDVKSVVSHGAEGVGLFRTEFLYLNRKALPTELEHYEYYVRVARSVLPYSVIIRTVDIGGDKLMDFGLGNAGGSEQNPFMGLRGIRLCLKHPEIFRIQIRAILRASNEGKVKIMFPMVSCIEEVRAARRIVDEVKAEMRREGHPFDEHIEMGIMIEIPSAALIVDQLAQEVDFMSIGTNDLIQYTLGVDRVNESVADLYNPLHPAILRLIAQTTWEAHKVGKWVGMCGEMASEPELTGILLGMGLDEFSVVPAAVPKLKETIRGLRYGDSQSLAQDILKNPTVENINQKLRGLSSP